MTNPWLITVLGMGTVFSALIIIALVLKLFPFFFDRKSLKALSKKDASVQESAFATVPAMTAQAGIADTAAATGLSGELVAVITAAIVASRGSGAGAFRIVSVNGSAMPGGFNTPAWGHIDRLVR